MKDTEKAGYRRSAAIHIAAALAPNYEPVRRQEMVAYAIAAAQALVNGIAALETMEEAAAKEKAEKKEEVV